MASRRKNPSKHPLADPRLPFERSDLWRAAFESSDAERYPQASEFFRQALLRLREKASLLVDQIAKDLPQLTVHDITHLDALWETGSLIAGPVYALNPAEGYVLGAAILLHDAAMTLASYPNRLADLIRTDEWQDAVAALDQGTDENIDSTAPSDSLVKLILPQILRALHARQAESLPFVSWHSGAGTEYLIDDPDLREFYGRLIGRVAKSHNDPASSLLMSLGTPTGAIAAAPPEWSVDPLKIACLLRTADAAHIDQRRAPRFLQSLIKPEKLSELHWTFQRKIAKPRLDGDALVYSSGPDFSLADADAWWLAFETVRMIDGELQEVDAVLENSRRFRFMARRVLGAESASAFSSFVRTEGWEPVDAKLKVSDVAHLIRLLGGAHLYGNDELVPIRELLQNSADAVQARRLIENTMEYKGNVTVIVTEDGDSCWLEVVDDGIGMSERTLTNNLLDFGRSFWKTDGVKLEFPGLLAKGLLPIGRFGIGFFAVFMLGEVVRVSSRRFDSALEATRTLEFRNGLELRPILRRATQKELIHDGGTRIAVLLKRSPYSKEGFLAEPDYRGNLKPKSLCRLLAALCPNVEITVQTKQNADAEMSIRSGDWLQITSEALLCRLSAVNEDKFEKLADYAKLVRPLTDRNRVYGMACVSCYHYAFEGSLRGVVTVGGFAVDTFPGIGGVLCGSTEVVTRNKATPVVPIAVLTAWAGEQVQLLSASALTKEEKLKGAAVLMRFGAYPGDLPIAAKGDEFLNASEIKALVADIGKVHVYSGVNVEYDKDLDSCHERVFEHHFRPDTDTLFLGNKDVVYRPGNTWPDGCFQTKDGSPPYSFWGVFKAALSDVWENGFEESESKEVVGEVDGDSIEREVTVYERNRPGS